MTSTLENFVISHPAVTLSHADYGLHFHIGHDVNIQTSPPQRFHYFVENDGSPEGSPYRFIIVGRLASFKIVEDTVRVSPFIFFEWQAYTMGYWVWPLPFSQSWSAPSVVFLHWDLSTPVGNALQNWGGGRNEQQLECAGSPLSDKKNFFFLYWLPMY